MKTGSLFVLVLSLQALAGCAGETVDVGAQKQVGSNETKLLAGHTASLDALCQAPHGPIDVPKVVAPYEKHVAGRWYRCDTVAGTPITATGQAIELSLADNLRGQYWALNVDADGNATRSTGLDDQGGMTFSVTSMAPDNEYEGETTPFDQAWMTTDAEAAKFTSEETSLYSGDAREPPVTSHIFEFESNPRRMRMDSSIWFVSMDGELPQ